MAKNKNYIRDGRAPIPEMELTSRIMSLIKDKNTIPELLLRKALWNNNLKGYRLHWSKVPGNPDIAFPGKHLAIFVNGCFWHRCPYCNPPTPKTHSDFWIKKFEANKKRDKIKIAELESIGWFSMTFWECQLKRNITDLLAKIENYLIEYENKNKLVR
jgi:DNA mismatch endonuclease (patch repair protein)